MTKAPTALRSGFQARWAELLRWCLIATSIYLVLNAGGDDPVSIQLSALLTALICLASLPIALTNPALHRVWTMIAVMLVGFGLIAFVQSIRGLPLAVDNAIWKLAKEALPLINGAISVQPEQTLASISALAPLLAALPALALAHDREATMRMLRRLAYFNGALAVFGLVQHVFLPNHLGFHHKISYLDSLTATFVNRNTAATFFGIGCVLSAALLVEAARRTDPERVFRKLASGKRTFRSSEKRYLLLVLMLVAQLTALFMTQSRGGVIFTIAGLLIFVLLFNPDRLSSRLQRIGSVLSRYRYRALLGVLLIWIVLWVLAARPLFRMSSEGVDTHRLCIYLSVLDGIWRYPIFGTGFGTFASVFPSLRRVDCLGIDGTVDAAHNSFLEGALTLGLAFWPLLALGLWSTTAALIEGLKRRQTLRFVPALGLGVLGLIFCHSFVDFPVQIPGLAYYAVLVLSCSVGISLLPDGDVRPKVAARQDEPIEIAPSDPSPCSPSS